MTPKGKSIVIAIIKAVVVIATLLLLLAVSGVSLLFYIYGKDLPDVNSLKTLELAETTRIYDRDGNVLYSIYNGENREYVPLSDISKNIIQATLSTEDRNFYHHLGFDLKGIIRAQLKNWKEEEIKEGASTITQQLARNIFLTPEKNIDRKIKELLLALQIEWNFSKDQILEMYFNKIPYGSNSYGIEAASETFFGKKAKELTLIEASIIASLPKAPSYYSPYGDHVKELMGYCLADEKKNDENSIEIPGGGESFDDQGDTIEETEATPDAEKNITSRKSECESYNDKRYIFGRKDYVLENMVKDGYITKEQMQQAWLEGKNIHFKNTLHRIEAPHFVFYIKELLEKKYGKEVVEKGGLEVRTSLDPVMQSYAEESIQNQAPINQKKYNANNAGLIAVNPKTGEILSMVGSVDYWNDEISGKVNVTTSFRQPGSSFKPFIYSVAIEKQGLGSGTMLSDKKTLFNKKDIPKNSDGKYKGPMTIRSALALSRNIPAIKAYFLGGEEETILDLMDQIGLNNLRNYKTEFNKKAKIRGWEFNYGWPLALGSGEVRLLDLVNAYGIFPNNGTYIELHPILEVRDNKGNILEKFDSQKKQFGQHVISPQTAYIISDILSDVYARPAGTWRKNLTIPGHTVAAKTGTTNKKIRGAIYPNDNIVIGYTPSLVVGVWVGNTDGTHMRGNAWGFLDAAPIWKNFLTQVLENKSDEKFTKPEGLLSRGKEIFPYFAVFKNFDRQFATVKEKTEVPPDTLSVDRMSTPVSNIQTSLTE